MQPNLDAADPEATRPSPRANRRVVIISAVIGTVVVLFGSVLAAASLIKVPYVVISPGSTYATNDRVAIGGGGPSYAPTGKIDFVTVSEDDDVSALERFEAEHDSNAEVLPIKSVIGDQSRTQNAAQQQLAMRSSKDVAAVVALQKLGYKVDTNALGALVTDIQKDMPADKAGLLPGDTITGLDGAPVKTSNDLRDLLANHKPGDTVELTVMHADSSVGTVKVTLAENPDKPGVAFLGIGLTDLAEPKLPFPVTISTDDVGGPSAGLAFTLAVIDHLTPGELTGGRNVAVTGTISQDGSVGAIGGIEQKVVAVERSGAKVFLVPADDSCGQPDGSCNYSDAKKKAGDKLTIVPVHNVDEALAALGQLGGNGLALGQPGAAG